MASGALKLATGKGRKMKIIGNDAIELTIDEVIYALRQCHEITSTDRAGHTLDIKLIAYPPQHVVRLQWRQERAG